MLFHNSQAMTALSTNRQRVLNALQAVEINEVIIRYRGSSDEGDITEIVIPSHDDQSPFALQDQLLAFSFVRGTYRCGAYHYFLVALLHKLRFRHKLPLPDNGLKDTLSDWRTQMSETV